MSGAYPGSNCQLFLWKVAQFNFVAHENASNAGEMVGGSSCVRVEVSPNEPVITLAESKYDVTTKITKRVNHRT